MAEVAPAPPPAAPTDAYGPVGRSPWLDVDWAAHSSWIEVCGSPLNVVQMGSGPPLVFVHGLSGSWQNWLEQIPVFARTHHVVALDLPGFGASPMPAQEISIAGYAEIVDTLCDRLGFGEVSLVGNSMGGFIAAEMAIERPARVERLVLVSAAGISTENAPIARVVPGLRIAERWLLAWTGWLASRSDFVSRRARLRNLTLATVAAHPARLPGPLAAEQLRGAGKPGFIDAFEALARYPIRDRLSRIAVPTLIVWGDRDPLITVRDADVFEELIDGSRKIVYRDTGHVSMFERPARFNADLAAFLAE